MERLTDIINGWTFEETIKTAESLMEAEKNMFKWDVLRHLRDFAENYRERIKEFQHLEEQGRLLKLPCKVGDIAYVDSETIPTKNMEFEEVKEIPLFFEAKAVSFRQNSNGNYIKLKVKAKWLHEWVDPDCGPDCAYFEVEKYFTYPLSSIGKTVFLTKSEAEKKLEELRGGENE